MSNSDRQSQHSITSRQSQRDLYIQYDSAKIEGTLCCQRINPHRFEVPKTSQGCLGLRFVRGFLVLIVRVLPPLFTSCNLRMYNIALPTAWSRTRNVTRIVDFDGSRPRKLPGLLPKITTRSCPSSKDKDIMYAVRRRDYIPCPTPRRFPHLNSLRKVDVLGTKNYHSKRAK